MAQDLSRSGSSSANAQASAHISDAVRTFTLNYGDANAHLTLAREADPECAMADIMQGWLLALSNDGMQVARARELHDGVDTAGLSNREGAHHKALRFAAHGQWPSAVAALDRHLMSDPHDLAGHQYAMRLDGYLGRFHRVAGRSARALPSWTKDDPNYGIMLSFYGFGLEELGDYARAEDVSRAAAELEPYGYWPHHAVSHVLEMTGRPDEGLAWMDGRKPYWSDANCNNRVHIWWHKALFHIELGQFDAALAIYDEEVIPAMRPVGTQLCNATALLWRLETLGCEAGERWQKQLGLWQQQLSGMSSPFNEIHAAMAALRAGDTSAYGTVLEGMERSAGLGGELVPAYRDVAIPIAKAMGRFVDKDYVGAVDGLLPVEAELWRMGGSIAQRDLVEWTLTEAAIRAGQKDVAIALSNERLALRPESVVNKQFLQEAEAIRV
ncbi:MAG: tetratricopeptide repeat protein [Pseudomonadota bacterium]